MARLSEIPSPLGPLLAVTDAAGALLALDYTGYEARMHRLLRRHFGDVPLEPGAAPGAVTQALGGYFAGQHAALDALTCATGGTAFQQAVWGALRAIPPGTTCTYAALAVRLGRPAAARAVGAANGANPVAIVIPCHRLVGADGRLTGYAGGLDRKAWLLAHEGVGV